MPELVVTFDLFSALIDSRSGGSAHFDQLARSRSWPMAGEALYDRWDLHNKAAQQETARREETSGRVAAGWVSYRRLAALAMSRVYAELSIEDDAGGDADQLIDSMSAWPLWPDVAEGLPVLAAEHRIGLLSNVDDDIFARTRAAGLVGHERAMTSQRLLAYKPGKQIYARARRHLDPMVHVATSARDVRGALEAGCPVIRLRRPGHRLDPAGPQPTFEAGALSELPRLLDQLG
jgi:2-haloalkanoic acid dehalogenase type II